MIVKKTNLIILSFIFLNVFSPTLAQESTDLLIGSTRQFFFDPVIVESIQNLTREIHRPDKMDQPVLQKDKPWEHITYFTCNAWNVIRDPKDQIFKAWYEDWMFTDQMEYAREGGKLHDIHKRPSRYLYARSADGILWEKPELGIQFENGKNTNIILGDKEFGLVHAAFIFLDPLAQTPDNRFKMLADNRTTNERKFTAMSSSDGIHWKRWDKLPVFGQVGQNLSDVITVAADTAAKIYMANNRHPRMYSIVHQDPVYRQYQLGWLKPVYPGNAYMRNMRRVFRSYSSDFIHWSTPKVLFAPDHSHDNWDDAFYGFVQYQSGGMWIGFLNVFHMTKNTMDVQLCYSRDGRTFERIEPGHAWLQTGHKDAWDRFMVNMPNAPVQVEDELYVYYGGSGNHHDWWIKGAYEGLDVPEAYDISKVNYALGLARMKVDRYLSLSNFGVRDGLLVTKPFQKQGDHLVINAKCRSGGSITVEVTDGNGSVLPGYERENCISFTEDGVDQRIRWQNKQTLPVNGFIKLRFFITNASLYTFQFVK
jgi:hypothetical protein